MTLEVGLIASRFVHYVAALGLLGASLFPLYALQGRADSVGWVHSDISRRLKRTLRVCAAAALLSAAGWFVFTAAAMADNMAAVFDPSVWLTVIGAGDFGPLWIGRASLIVIVVLLLIRWPSGLSLWLVPLLAAAVVASLAATGHARETEGLNGVLHKSADAAHLVAAGVWLGGLWPLFVALAAPLDQRRPANVSSGALLLRFSGVGMVAVVVLAGSGVANSWFLVGTLRGLISTTYGQMLMAKIVLFLAMVALASANRFWIVPRLAGPGLFPGSAWQRRIRRHVVAEQVLGLFVLAVVSVLGTIQPPIES